jgi:hypothetical protein
MYYLPEYVAFKPLISIETLGTIEFQKARK